MANDATTYVDQTAITARASEVPGASWTTGMNNSTNSPGLGIATDNPGLDESLPSWTLLDQDGDARAPQASQVIGGYGFVANADYPSSGGVEGKGNGGADAVDIVANPDFPDNDGSVTVVDTVSLLDLAVGWEDSTP